MYRGFGGGEKKEGDWQQVLAEGQSSSPREKEKENKNHCIRNEKGITTTHTTDIKRIVRECYEQLYVNFDALDQFVLLNFNLKQNLIKRKKEKEI